MASYFVILFMGLLVLAMVGFMMYYTNPNTVVKKNSIF